MNDLVKILGNKIRMLRTEKKITLKGLADEVCVTASLISQIERGLANPSISSLKAIADVLEVSVAELLEEKNGIANKRSPVIRSGNHKVILTGDGTHHTLLNPGKMETEVILVEFPPGSSTGKSSYEHTGYECGYVLTGKICVILEDIEYELHPGDSIVFESKLPHKIINETNKTAEAIWVNNVPWIFAKYKGV